MRCVGIFLLLLFSLSCSTKVSDETQTDPLTPDESEFFTEHAAIKNADSLATLIGHNTDSLLAQIKERVSSYYTITASHQGYESSTEATWYFDSLMNLVYCDVNWNLEGTSGSFQYVFKNEELVAGTEENSYNDYEETIRVNKNFAPVFGFSRTNGTETDSLINFLGQTEFTDQNSSAANDYSRLIRRISELADSATEEKENFSIHTEQSVNYGVDVTETEDYTISKPVFLKLIKRD